MSNECLAQIDFPEQSKYEANKGFIKSIIKDAYKLKVWDGLGQRWWDGRDNSIEVKRIELGGKTVGLKVYGDKALADALINYCVGVGGVVLSGIDIEVAAIVECEVIKYSNYINQRVDRGEISREEADEFIRRWAQTVKYCEYEKRGVEY